jgi:hypothetical protein
MAIRETEAKTDMHIQLESLEHIRLTNHMVDRVGGGGRSRRVRRQL